MIEVTIPNPAQLERDLGITRARLIASVKAELGRAAIDLSGHVKANKLSGQVLKVRTGRLRRSINYRLEESATGVEAKVGTNVVYARFHELGKRPFLRPALEEKRRQIDARIARAVAGAIAGPNKGSVL